MVTISGSDKASGEADLELCDVVCKTCWWFNEGRCYLNVADGIASVAIPKSETCDQWLLNIHGGHLWKAWEQSNDLKLSLLLTQTHLEKMRQELAVL